MRRLYLLIEKILVSPDYAANYQGAIFSEVVKARDEKTLQDDYQAALEGVKAGNFDSVLFVGDRSLPDSDQKDLDLLKHLNDSLKVVSMLCDAEHPLAELSNVLLPARSILEKQGLLINRAKRLQYNENVRPFPSGTHQHWKLLDLLGREFGGSLTSAKSDRERTLEYLQKEKKLQGIRIRDIKGEGVDLTKLSSQRQGSSEAESVQPGA